MNSLLSWHTAPGIPVQDQYFAYTQSWQSRIVPQSGVLLEFGKVSGDQSVKQLSLIELEIVHALADAINTERVSRIRRVIERFELTEALVEPLLGALNLELAVTGVRKKFVAFENGQFKARTFSGGVVFQQTLGT
jgi:hypothetical protein